MSSRHADTPAHEDVDLSGIVLPDARTGRPVDLGATEPPTVVSLIRHRY